MKPSVFHAVSGLLILVSHAASAESGKSSVKTFEQHIQSNWLKAINQQTETISRNPLSVLQTQPDLIPEKPEDQKHQKKLEDYYQSGDFDALQSYGEQRAQQLETELSPEGEAWRLLNQSIDHYYPDANDSRLLQPMELAIKALQHPNTWSSRKGWPTDAQHNTVYDNNHAMNLTIAQLRQHFKGCEYQKKLSLQGSRMVHSPDIRECSRALVNDSQLTLQREVSVPPLVRVIASTTLSSVDHCSGRSEEELCLQIRLGKSARADNYYRCHCCIKEESIRVAIPQYKALRSVVLHQARWDDRLQIWIDADKVWQSHRDFPPEHGRHCELNSNSRLDAPSSLRTETLLEKSEGVTFKIRTSVGDKGEGFALIRLYFDIRQLDMSDEWHPAAAKHQLQTMRQWQQDDICRLTFQCLEHLDKGEYSIQHQLIPLWNPQIRELAPDCKTAKVAASCFYHQGYKAAEVDSCAHFANNPECEFLESHCLGGSPSQESGVCYTRLDHYDCGYKGQLQQIGIKEKPALRGPADAVHAGRVSKQPH